MRHKSPSGTRGESAERPRDARFSGITVRSRQDRFSVFHLRFHVRVPQGARCWWMWVCASGGGECSGDRSVRDGRMAVRPIRTALFGGVSDTVRVRCVFWGCSVDRFGSFGGSCVQLGAQKRSGYACAPLFACATGSSVTSPSWQTCTLSSFGRLLHSLHVSPPEGALTSCHTSSPSDLHRGTVLAIASKVDHFREKSFTDAVRHPPLRERGVSFFFPCR